MTTFFDDEVEVHETKRDKVVLFGTIIAVVLSVALIALDKSGTVDAFINSFAK